MRVCMWVCYDVILLDYSLCNQNQNGVERKELRAFHLFSKGPSSMLLALRFLQ